MKNSILCPHVQSYLKTIKLIYSVFDISINAFFYSALFSGIFLKSISSAFFFVLSLLLWFGGQETKKEEGFYIWLHICFSYTSIIRQSTRGVLTTLSLISSTSASSAELTMTTTPGVPEGASVAVVVLLLLLLLRDFLPLSKHWEDSVKTSLNLGIIPLLFSFGAIILYKLVALF